MAIKILLTGAPGCGKTTLVHRVIDQLEDLRLTGFYTREVRGADGHRTGFRALGLHGGSTILASVDSKSKVRVGKYGVELSGFERLLREEFQCSGAESDLCVVDEIGKMECFSPLFVELIEELLRGARPLLATVANTSGGLMGRVKQREDIELIRVTAGNRNELAEPLAARLRESARSTD